MSDDACEAIAQLADVQVALGNYFLAHRTLLDVAEPSRSDFWNMDKAERELVRVISTHLTGDAEVERLRAAIRKHRDERGHNRCWLDDRALYSVLPEGGDVSPLPCKVDFLRECERYWNHRQVPGSSPAPETWRATQWVCQGDLHDPTDVTPPHIALVTSPFYQGERYAVRRGGYCLSVSGEWEFEPIPSDRDDAFYQRFRFHSFEAAELALRSAPS